MTRSGPVRLLALIGAGTLVLTACGGSESTSTDTAPEVAATQAADGDAAADGGAGDGPGAAGTDVPTTDPVAADPAASGDDASSEPVEDGGAASTPTTAAGPTSTTLAEPVPGGRLLAAELSPASDVDGNPLPDLVVEDVRRGEQVNLRNVFPAARPVLVWMWAPH